MINIKIKEIYMNSLVELFCNVDDWCKANEAIIKEHLLPFQGKKYHRSCRLTVSEIMTIIIHFHQSHYRDFKHYYLDYVKKQLFSCFPGLVSYTRFVELKQQVLLSLSLYLQSRFGQVSGISFIDSAKISVCHNKRIARHKVFQGVAARGKSSMGWFYGFKLHLVVNEQGELLNVTLTPGNTDDREPVPKLSRDLFGKLFGDKGYLSQSLFIQLYERGVELITTIRKNMKPRVMSLIDRLLLRKRFIIETIIDQLKNISQIEHSRHRSIWNFMVNLLGGLIAYTFQPKKPRINFNYNEQQQLDCWVI